MSIAIVTLYLAHKNNRNASLAFEYFDFSVIKSPLLFVIMVIEQA